MASRGRRERVVASVAAALVLLFPSWALAQETPEGEPTATAAPEPSSEPSSEPAPDPEPEPSSPPSEPAPEPEPEPSSPEPDPEPAPDSPAAPSRPPRSAGPSAQPTRSPGEPGAAGPGALSPFDPPPGPAGPDGTGPPEPGHHHDLAEATAAVEAAHAALAAARADLEAARATVLEARSQVQAAQARGEQLRRDLAAAVEAEERAERAIDRIRRRMEATRLDLGVVAGQAYRGDSYATLSVVLDASSPAEFAEGYTGMRALLRANDSALGALAADAADLADEHARLEAARELQQRFTREAEAAAAAKAAAEQVAREVQAHLADLVTRREDALVAAEEARRADRVRYQTFLAQSSAVGATILDGAARLRAGADVVEGTGDLAPPGVGRVTSGFGPRLHPILGYVKLHTGLDLGRGDGYVYAADAGTVVVAGSDPAYGNMTVVDHGSFGGQQLATLYAHQATLFVAEGDIVARGQRIGRIGSTGYSTGPHLHFEVRLDGRAVDPWPWISRTGGRAR